MFATDAESINKKIIALWEMERKSSNIATFLTRVPQFFVPVDTSPNKELILYVGLNPSFSDRNFSVLAKKIKDKDKKTWFLMKSRTKVNSFYAYGKAEITKNYLTQLEEINRIFVENFPYFAKIKKIAGDCRLILSVTDLFLMRETSQKEVRKITFSDKKEQKLTDFAKRQIKIFFEIVQAINPRVILVGNALASSILKNYMNKSITWNDHLGTYIANINSRVVPIFFSGMLSGQRALDNHSMERLEWQIKRCINYTN